MPMNRLVRLGALVATAAVPIFILQVFVLNHEPPGLKDADTVIKDAENSLNQDPSVNQALAPNHELKLEGVASQSILGIKFWSKQSITETAERYLGQKWRGKGDARDLAANARALRKVAQAQAYVRSRLGEPSLASSVSGILYGWPQALALTLLLAALASNLSSRLKWIPGLDAHTRRLFSDAILITGAVGFLAEVAEALSAAETEGALRIGIGRALHPVLVSVAAAFLTEAAAPTTAAAGQETGLEEAVRRGVLGAAQVVVRGLEEGEKP